jgi:two-component system sensor histidine kinase DegS
MLALAINIECLPDRCHGNTETCNARVLAMQAREMAEHVRHMAHAMRPGILDRMGLVPALRTIVQEANTDTLRSVFRLRGKAIQMPWSVETTLYRVALELLTNVRKHSCATQVLTTMAFRRADVTLTVEDNGVGFSRPPDLMTLARQGKYGIVGLYERAENLDASLDISSKPGSGTRVRIVVPYSSQKVQDIRGKAWPGTPETIEPAVT